MSARASSWSLEHAGGLAGAGHQGAIAHNKPAAFRALGKAGGVCFLSGLDFSDEGGNELKVGSGSAKDEGPRGPASGGGGGDTNLRLQPNPPQHVSTEVAPKGQCWAGFQCILKRIYLHSNMMPQRTQQSTTANQNVVPPGDRGDSSLVDLHNAKIY